MLLSKVSEGFEERGGTVFFLEAGTFWCGEKKLPFKNASVSDLHYGDKKVTA